MSALVHKRHNAAASGGLGDGPRTAVFSKQLLLALQCGLQVAFFHMPVAANLLGDRCQRYCQIEPIVVQVSSMTQALACT